MSSFFPNMFEHHCSEAGLRHTWASLFSHHFIVRAIVLGAVCVSPVSATTGPATIAPAVPGFTVEQAAAGKMLYKTVCASCHGASLEGAGAAPLAGPEFLEKWTNGGHSGTELFEIVVREMPANAPGSLTISQGLSLLAYTFAESGYPPAAQPLTVADLKVTLLPPTASATTGTRRIARATPPVSAFNYVLASSDQPDDAEILAARADNWLLYNRDLHGTRYSSLAQINRHNVERLQVKCVIQLGEVGSFQTAPVVRNGRMYVTTPHSTYALDLRTCRVQWEHVYLPEDPEPWLANRGVAFYRGSVFRGTPDGHLIALDANTGKLLWNTWVADSRKGYFLSGAPVAFDGKVFIGEAGADWGANGHIHAFDTITGQRVWTFDVIPTGDQPGAETWGAGAEHGGGSLWSTLTLHPKEGLLYASTGNPAPDYNGSVRPGANLYTDSMIALDFRTGKLVWYVQLIPHDVHDWNIAAAPTVYDRDGRDYLTVAGKDGWLYLYDRHSHELVVRQEVSAHLNAESAPTPEGVHTCPGPVGGVEWNGVAYAPDPGLLFVNSVDWCATFFQAVPNYVEGAPYTGGRTVMDSPETAKGWVRAFDAVTGQPTWTYQSATPMVAAVTPTAGELVLTGDLNGDFLAFDARKGQLLYRFPTGGAIAGGVVTYLVDGEQYIAATSGNSSRTVWKTRGAASIFVFGLPDDDLTKKTRR